MKRWIALCFVLVFACIAPAGAADKVRISIGSFNINNLPFPLAENLGYFRDEGLDVTVENFASGGSRVLQALLAASTDLGVGFYDHTIQMQAKNKDLVAVVLLARNSGLVMAAGRGITANFNDLRSIRGMKVGITAPGSSSDFFVKYLLKTNGMQDKDVRLVSVGSGPSAVAALEHGQIDLLVNYDPAATLIEERQIGRIVFDARTDAGAAAVYGGVYPTSTLYTTADYIRDHPEIVQKVVNALVRTLKWMNQHNAEEIFGRVPAEYAVGDKTTYIRAITEAKDLFAHDGRFDPANLETPLKVMRAFNESIGAREIDLSRTYTNAFVERAATR
jgi:NitT/TauT family transport system substrate-binding protein